jgi:beta-ureidopropionase / N-carbamoyl-L-amino-acid hydrolase
VDAIIAGIEQRRGVHFHRGPKARAAVGQVDQAMKRALEDAAAKLGIPVLQLGSPASHDAAAFGAAGVPMGMIFVRNENGSHNPHEAMAIDDFMAGSSLLSWYLSQQFADLSR